jgi:hypothetical protein
MAFVHTFRVWLLVAEWIVFGGLGAAAIITSGIDYNSSVNNEVMAMFFTGFVIFLGVVASALTVVYRYHVNKSHQLRKEYTLEPNGDWFDQEPVRVVSVVICAIIMGIVEWNSFGDDHTNLWSYHVWAMVYTFFIAIWYWIMFLIYVIWSIVDACSKDGCGWGDKREDNPPPRVDPSSNNTSSSEYARVVIGCIWMGASFIFGAIGMGMGLSQYSSTGTNQVMIVTFYGVLVVFTHLTAGITYLFRSHVPRRYALQPNGDLFDQEPIRQVLLLAGAIILWIVIFSAFYDPMGSLVWFHNFAIAWAIWSTITFAASVFDLICALYRLFLDGSYENPFIQFAFGHSISSTSGGTYVPTPMTETTTTTSYVS